MEELQQLKAKTAALEASLLAEIDAREIPRKQLAWGSTADWYTHLAGTTRGEGKRTVKHARELVGERRATYAALAAGDVSPQQAGVILDAIRRLPKATQVRRRGEQTLIDGAGRLNASELHRAGRHLLAVVDPEGEEKRAEKDLDREERAAHLDRGLSITDDGLGGVRIRGRGTVEDGATLRAALLPFTKPKPAEDKQGTATESEGCEPGEDTRDHGARMWDALVQLAEHALNTDIAPASHGARPRVTVTIDADTLHDHNDERHSGSGSGSGSGVGVTDDGLDLSAAAVRRMACDCDLIRVLLDTDGCPLDVGRTHRLVTPAIWTALVARDQHCAFPGCTRPPVMGHAHHIRHWINGGPTSLENLVLLCGHHHRTIHHTPWQVRLAADGKPEFLPPPKAGRPPPEWIRHRCRRE
ncbi:HNH endonuclease signature motif containing protein [Nocardioides sp.]|uniref:HNH endonuclease signature motif containing protein n=1 Tax=Nocardioides sp. TaxID=35761 RepID=UPI002ED160F6